MTGKRVAGLVLCALGIGAAVAGAVGGMSPAVAFYGGGGAAGLLGLALLVLGGEGAPPPNYAAMTPQELAAAPGPKCRACRKPTRWVAEHSKHYCHTCRLYA